MMNIEAMKKALEAAYLAGFNASGEGYNAEYPFSDRGEPPAENRGWVKDRDDYVSQAIANAEQDEPVAWRGYNWGHSPDDWVYRDFDNPILDGNGNNVGQPLYTHPQPRKPLTDEQISDLWCKTSNTDFVTADTHVFARAIEAAHGIKE
jgi:hypothetical protein